MADKEISIRITAKNLTDAEFEKAKKGIAGIAKATSESQTATKGFADTLKGMAGTIGIAFSVAGVVGFTKSVFDTASQIHDMAERLGISAEAVQGFKFAAEQAGSSLEAVGTAITKMNQHLAEGDKSTVGALKDAGLNFATIRAMKPEDAFLAIADAIEQMPDPMEQSRIALALFGKGAAELLPAIKEHFRSVADGVEKMSTKTVNDLEAAQDSWSKFGHGVTVATGQALGGVMRFFGAITEFGTPASIKAAAAANTLTDAQKENVKWLLKMGNSAEVLAPTFGAASGAALKYAHSLETSTSAAMAGTDAERLARLNKDLHAEATVHLSSEVTRYIARAVDANKSTEDIAKELIKAGLATDDARTAISLAVEAHKKAATATEAHTQKLADLDKKIRDAQQDVGHLSEFTKAQIEFFDRLGLSAEDIALKLRVSAAAVKIYTENVERGRKATEDWADVQKEMAKLTEESTRRIRDGIIQAANDEAKALGEQQTVQLKALADFSEKNRQLALSGTTLKLRQIQIEQDAVIASLGTQRGEQDKFYGMSREQVDAYYQHLTDLATGTQSTIVERMRATGIPTRADLDLTAATAQRDFDQMKASGQFSAEAIRAAHEKALKAIREATADTGGSFTRLFQGAFGSAQDFGTNLAGTVMGAIKGGGDVLNAAGSFIGTNLTTSLAKMLTGPNGIGGALGGAINAILPGLGSLLGPLASKIGGFFKGLFSNAGRDSVVDFANAMGGFDAIHAKLLEIGAAGEQLWIKLTQGVPKGNKEAAQAAIQAVTDALEAHKQKQGETAKAAEEAAGRETAALDAVHQRITDQIKSLDDQQKSLQDSIANEAPEDVMGVIETQTRARIAQIEAEKRALDAQQDDAVSAAQAARSEVEKVWADPLHVPVTFDIPDRPGFGGGGRESPEPRDGFASGGIASGPMIARLAERGRKEIVGDVDFMAEALSGALARLSTGAGSPGGGTGIGVGPSGDIVIHQTIMLDGQVIDRRIVRTAQAAALAGQIQIPTRAIRGANG